MGPPNQCACMHLPGPGLCVSPLSIYAQVHLFLSACGRQTLRLRCVYQMAAGLAAAWHRRLAARALHPSCIRCACALAAATARTHYCPTPRRYIQPCSMPLAGEREVQRAVQASSVHLSVRADC